MDLPLPMKKHRKVNIPKGLRPNKPTRPPAFKVKGNSAQNGQQIRNIFDFQVLNGDQGIVVRSEWPVRRDTVGFYDGRRLSRKLEAVRLVNCYLLFPRGRHVRPSCIASELVLGPQNEIRQGNQLEVQFESYRKVSDNMEM